MDSWFRHEELQTTLLDVNYAYDANGLRISKKAGTVEHKYFYDGGNLVYEGVGSTSLRFAYDENGLLSALTYNNGTTSNRYFYVRDILLNIIGLKDVLGYLVVRYNYDAWGNILSVTGSEASTVGQANPFRYKGYYFDSETRMYYCQSRYYVPQWCRWLSADDPSYLEDDSPKGVNLFAYCGNDPVNNVDPSGHIVISLLFALIATFVISASASVVSQGIQYGMKNINWIQVAADGLFGLTSVAFAATGIGMFASIGIGAVMGFCQYGMASGLHDEQITLSGALVAVGIGAVCGAISGYGARHIKSIVGSMSDDVGGSGIKAITSAANRLVAGEISPQGFQGVCNLFGKGVFSAVQAAVPGAIAKGFTTSAIKVFITSAFAPFFNYYGNKALNS